MDEDDISRSTIERLPLYKKAMEELLQAGRSHASSTEIAEQLHLSDSQIRKDLSYFGKFGVRGKGYEIQSLVDEISEILGTDEICPCILVGVGNLGQALLSYGGFQKHNFRIESAFDVDPDKIGSTVGGTRIRSIDDLADYLSERGINLAILAVPAESGPELIDELVDNGIRGILNFAPFVPEVPDDVIVESVDLSTNLEVLAYFMNNSDS
ncbi:MAG: redox-sensing transcriptional repressor Rex [bacterium]